MSYINKMNIILEILQKTINQQNAFYVFPTQTAADLWADKIISESSTTAVAMERFLAWDSFKGNSIKSKHQEKKAIPSVMRQIFTAMLIGENGEKPFLKSMIVPEYAKGAAGFTDWISSVLTGLSTWKKYFDKNNVSKDDEDDDLLEIYNRYKTFLDSHNCFDPAWETPPFEADGNHYYIFFPEILSDYTEYEEILKSSSDISIINFPDSPDYISPDALFYTNSRIELKALALNLLDLHKNKNIAWNQIAVSVPDLDTEGVYIDRELSMFQIPHVMRYSKPLTSFSAGNLFNHFKECTNNNFNYESIKNLLLNTSLPWIKSSLSDDLIAYGQNNNCICSFVQNGEQIDIWEESFIDSRPSIDLIAYYRSLKDLIQKIVYSNTFKEIREGYFNFRNKFFNMEECPLETDLIISRCISELGNLIDLQESPDFKDCIIPNPYSFFVNYLNTTKYLAQTSENGVQILPYKMAATAPFDVHLIIDSSQTSLSVIYKPLSFLRDDKRKKLFCGREDPNVTEKFIKLYQMNSMKEEVYFSAAVKTFTGYGQLSSYLNECKSKDEEILFSNDENNTFEQEKLWFERKSDFPQKLNSYSVQGFDFWQKCQDYTKADYSDETIEKIIERIKIRRFTQDGFINVSYSTLKKFYECPRAWLIKAVTQLNEQNNEATLMDRFEMGNLYHKIFELFFKELKNRNLSLILDSQDHLSSEYDSILCDSITKAIKVEKISYLAKQQLITMYDAIHALVLTSLEKFFTYFVGFSVFEIESEHQVLDKENKIRYEGKIDAIFQEPGSGDLTLVDFKTSSGSVPSNLYIDENQLLEDGIPILGTLVLEEQSLPAFQMPLYIYLLRNDENSPIKIENCCYYSIKNMVIKRVAGDFSYLNNKNSKFKDMESYEKEIEKTIECVEHFAERIENCNFEINKSVQSFSVCNSCEYRAICRKVFNIGKKN